MYYEDIFTKDDSVCRTALATMGLLITAGQGRIYQELIFMFSWSRNHQFPKLQPFSQLWLSEPGS